MKGLIIDDWRLLIEKLINNTIIINYQSKGNRQ